jgi:tetratricopeptide (TPR) repeat protein
LATLVWYALDPVSLARVYGQTLGPTLIVDSLDLAVANQIRRIPQGETLTVNPQWTLSIKGLNTNRWKNYDLLFYSPDLEVNQIVRGEATLAGLLGQDAFLEPRAVTVEVREGAQVVGRFGLRGAYTAADFGQMAAAAVESAQKISYYRKALALEPQSPLWGQGLREALLDAGQTEELLGLWEGDLAKASGDRARSELLTGLLSLYRGKGDRVGETKTLERLLTLAERNGQSQGAQSLKAALAALRKVAEPGQAAELYEELVASAAEPQAQRAYLGELISLYRSLGQAVKEERAYLRLLPLASTEESPGVWGEILRLREKSGDRVGQMEAWAALAQVLPSGEAKANAYKRLGFLRYESKEYEAAEKAYLAAINESQADGATYLNLARLALAKADRVAYRNYLVQALALDDQPSTRLELAQALTEDGLTIDAAAAWEVLATLPGSGERGRIRALAQSQLINLRRPPEGELSEEFERLLYSHGQESVEFYNLGVAHFQRKNWDQAIKAFLKALELDHNRQLEGDARGYLLATYKEKGQVKEMLEQAGWLYPADPSKKEVRDLIAHQLESERKWAELVKTATEWTGQDDEADNWRYLALGQEKLGRAKEAAQSLLKAAQRDANKPVAWLRAAQALEKTGQKAQAKTAYEKVLALDPDNRAAETALVSLAMEALSNRDNR